MVNAFDDSFDFGAVCVRYLDTKTWIQRQKLRDYWQTKPDAIVAASLIVILGLAGLAIDLVALYADRSEMQRAADAGALAGAQQFVTSSFITGGTSQSQVTVFADDASVAAAEENTVGGQKLVASDVVTTPDFSRSGNPLMTVQISKSMPTFFMRVFGRTSMTVAATATAEAYDPGTNKGPTFCASCVKPFLVPNCDPSHPVSGSSSAANASCPTVSNKKCAAASADCQSVFLNTSGLPINPGVKPGGIIGETWSLHTNAAPSQYYELDFGSAGGATLRTDIEQCSATVISCGTVLQTDDGKKLGPTDQGICDLITYSTGKCNGAKSATSVDSITFNAAGNPPYTITAGGANPFFAGGTPIGQSASLITVPVYDGHSLTPGKDTVTVVGYMQMFVTSFDHTGPSDTISAMIVGVSSCGTTGGPACGSPTGTISGGGASFVPVRLVHP